ncbi:hypothetical protein VP01_628g7 [Puccinia sorghi]|uniref:RED-like N-terminal domain-containing protein n=1 Tax=Puccinia sorghi TaxID=27349 RepID=A0A0L6UIG8_9BASI|nr:hypothetical protein VP01_628g7 [Puccinia sorghi]
MDQDAFRALLSTAHPQASQPTTRPNGRLVLGGGSIGRSTYTSNPSGSGYKSASASTSLKPRKFKPKESADGAQKDASRSAHVGYRDRASERRRGLDGDFAEAEHLLENFQARVTAAGDQIDKEVLEQQTKYLVSNTCLCCQGGDERHTILVKGLDHALLERRKAELAEGGKLGQVTDDDLELAYEQNAKHSPSENLGLKIATAPKVKRKHRDELLEQLKTSRAPADLVVVEKLKAAGKFKPIGSTRVDDAKHDEERKERKRRRAEKKEKKKLKALKSEEQAVINPTPTASTDPVTEKPPDRSGSTALDASSPVKRPVDDGHEVSSPKSVKPPTETSNNQASTAIPPETSNGPQEAVKKNQSTEDDDDFDIFGDAGEYKGLDADSSEDEEARERETVPVDVGSATKKRKTYFEEDEDESRSNCSEKRKSTEESASKICEAIRKTVAIELEPEEDGDERDGTRHGGAAGPPPGRTKLEGLSGSADIRSILAADALQEKEEKRKAKKQKNKAGGSKILTDQDRLNRDVLEMENFLKRKKAQDSSATAPT